jgi:hypothetical protein
VKNNVNQYAIIPLFNYEDSVRTSECVFWPIRITILKDEYLSKLHDALLQEVMAHPRLPENRTFKIEPFTQLFSESLLPLNSFFFTKELTCHPRMRKHLFARQQTRLETCTSAPVWEILIVSDIEIITGHTFNLLLTVMLCILHHHNIRYLKGVIPKTINSYVTPSR